MLVRRYLIDDGLGFSEVEVVEVTVLMSSGSEEMVLRWFGEVLEAEVEVLLTN